jgi:hypothetical protein
MFYKVFKLTTGDTIVGLTEDTCETFKGKEFVEILNPVKINVIKTPFTHPSMGKVFVQTHTLEYLLNLSSDTAVKIPVSCILFATNANDAVIDNYEKFNSPIEEEEEYDDEEGIPKEPLDDEGFGFSDLVEMMDENKLLH